MIIKIFKWFEFLLIYKIKFCCLVMLDGMVERIINIGSVGKIFSVMGWKIGWVVGFVNLMDVL